MSDFRCQKYLSENVLKINCLKKVKKILNTTFTVESFITLKTYNSKNFPGNVLEFSIKYLPAAAPGTNKTTESIFIIRLSTIRLTTRNWSFFFLIELWGLYVGGGDKVFCAKQMACRFKTFFRNTRSTNIFSQKNCQSKLNFLF